MAILNRIDDLKQELDSLRPLSSADEQRIMQKFRLDWNYHSNNLEGNSLTYGETKALIMFGTTAQGKPIKDAIEIQGHNEAIEMLVEVVKQERPLTETFLRELHVLLLKNSYKVDAITDDGKPTTKIVEVGKYKSTQNHVITKTGEIFRFAEPEETEAEMTALMDWYKEKKTSNDIHPVVLASQFHYRFIRIHPFDDGNGRIARLVMNFILMMYGFPPVIIKTEDKENYFSVLRSADLGDIEPFINYISENLVNSLDIMISGAKGESIEEPDDIDKKFALFEAKMKGLTTENIKLLDDDVKIDVFNHSFVPLANSLLSKMNKFKQYYEKSSFKLEYFGIGDLVDDSMQISPLNSEEYMIKKAVSVAVNSKLNGNQIAFRISFKYFKNLNHNNLSFAKNVVYSFLDTNYQVSCTGSKNTIRKNYNERLTDVEIRELVNEIVESHMSLISDKLGL